jgi:hypothetical protein
VESSAKKEPIVQVELADEGISQNAKMRKELKGNTYSKVPTPGRNFRPGYFFKMPPIGGKAVFLDTDAIYS